MSLHRLSKAEPRSHDGDTGFASTRRRASIGSGSLIQFPHEQIDRFAACSDRPFEFLGLERLNRLSIQLSQFIEIDLPAAVTSGLDEFTLNLCQIRKQRFRLLRINDSIRGRGQKRRTRCSGRFENRRSSGVVGIGWRIASPLAFL